MVLQINMLCNICNISVTELLHVNVLIINLLKRKKTL